MPVHDAQMREMEAYLGVSRLVFQQLSLVLDQAASVVSCLLKNNFVLGDTLSKTPFSEMLHPDKTNAAQQWMADKGVTNAETCGEPPPAAKVEQRHSGCPIDQSTSKISLGV